MDNEIVNKLICGDNLEELHKLPKESVDLIYIDPPFFSNKQYEVVWGDEAEVRSFKDRWEGGTEHYISWMRPRVEAMYEVLKETGSFYLHCDWHANAYLRIMCDEIFGGKNFRNEIIWCYTGAAAPGQRHFNRKHDVLFWYTKGENWTFKPYALKIPFAESTRRRAQHTDGSFGRVRSKPLPDYKFPEDWWSDIVALKAGKERLGYPTQKPEALLERIIQASSKKDDLVLDAFCGCGTTMAVAHRLGRRWIGIDISPTAIKLVEKRLFKVGAEKDKDYISIGSPTTIKELKSLEPFEFQNWVVNEMNGRQSKKKVGDMGLDGHIPKDLFREAAGIQVKQRERVGRNPIDNFKSALERGKYKKGYFVAFSFTKGAYEEVARLKNIGKLHIELVEIEDLLYKKEPLG